MLGVVITLAVIAAVAWCIFKNYYPPTVLLIAGLLFLAVAACFGVDPVPAKASTHFLGFDFAQAFTDRMKTRLPGLGLNIMWIAGFSYYMDKIGASKALVKLCVKPLSAIRSPYLLLAVTYIVGQFMALFINSAVGLGLLLMASIFPLLVALGVSKTSAAAVIGSTCCLDLGPSSSNAMRAADLLNTDVVTYFVQNQIPVALCVIAVVAIGHFFIQRWFDKKDGIETSGAGTQEDVAKAFEGAGPVWYSILPMLPLVLLIIFSPMVYQPVKLSLQTAIIISILVSFVVDLITTRGVKDSIGRTKAVYEGMGKVFTSTVALICCAELFAFGMTKVGGITTMINAAASMESAGLGDALHHDCHYGPCDSGHRLRKCSVLCIFAASSSGSVFCRHERGCACRSCTAVGGYCPYDVPDCGCHHCRVIDRWHYTVPARAPHDSGDGACPDYKHCGFSRLPLNGTRAAVKNSGSLIPFSF